MRVLIVDDELEIARSLRRGLDEAGINAEYYLSGNAALSAARSGIPFDVAILDVGLDGDLDGFEVCAALRRTGAPTAILMLTAHDEVRDRLHGFDVGADDFLAKPFVFDEVLARVRALGRRRIVPPHRPELEAIGISVNTTTREVVAAGTALDLTRREFEVLELFVRHSGQYLTREQIHDTVWSYDVDPESSLVEGYIGRLRRKLRAAGSTTTIHNSRGVGYRLATEIARPVAE